VSVKLRATARLGTLTALEVACGVDALPCTCTPSKHAAGSPAVPTLGARAAADPALLVGGRFVRRARVEDPAYAAAACVRSDAGTRSWVLWGRGRETVRAGEPTSIFDALRYAIIWVGAGIDCDLK
jgi:hypothetical protein